MPRPNRSAHRDVNPVVFALFVTAVLIADYVVLLGKEPFGS